MTAPNAAAHNPARHGSGELNWLLDELVQRVASIRKALVLSSDGLATGASADLTREDSEHLAAVASGFHSLAKGWATTSTRAGCARPSSNSTRPSSSSRPPHDGSCLAVLAEADSDVGQVAYEMTLMVKRVGAHLANAPRTTGLPAGG